MQYSALSAGELVRQCARSADKAAWEEFVRRFHRLIAGVVLAQRSAGEKLHGRRSMT